jgi:hypothetical protein
MSSLTVTADQIINHRAGRKAAGLIGCISGRPVPEPNLFGYRDVQIWNCDAEGRLNGDPGFDRMNPSCFCFDCRAAFDPRAEVDLELLQVGHARAREVYADLFRVHDDPAPSFRSYSERIPDVEPILIVDTSAPAYNSFEEIPTSLPAPRHRDVMHESPTDRLKSDLAELRGRLNAELVPTMDKRRMAACMEDADVPAFLAEIDAAETALWFKIKAIDTLLADL